jgi:glyoxalase family protein
MVHTILWAVRDLSALSYWSTRLLAAGVRIAEHGSESRPRLVFTDPEGIRHELAVDPAAAAQGLVRGSAAIPPRAAISGLRGVRAYGRENVASADILAGRLGFEVTDPGTFRVGGSVFGLDEPPALRARLGAGTIHHVAWSCDGPLSAWRQRVIGMGCKATRVIDRGHCRSIYFREPSGVQFEIATDAPGDVDAGGARAERVLSPAIDPRVRTAAVG